MLATNTSTAIAIRVYARGCVPLVCLCSPGPSLSSKARLEPSSERDSDGPAWGRAGQWSFAHARRTRCYSNEELEEGSLGVSVANGGGDGWEPLVRVGVELIRDDLAVMQRAAHDEGGDKGGCAIIGCGQPPEEQLLRTMHPSNAERNPAIARTSR